MMVVWLNSSSSIGTVFTAFTENIAGTEFITLLCLIIFIMLILFMFKIPVEASIIIVLPMVLIWMAYSGAFLGLGVGFLLYLGFLFAKNYFITG